MCVCYQHFQKSNLTRSLLLHLTHTHYLSPLIHVCPFSLLHLAVISILARPHRSLSPLGSVAAVCLRLNTNGSAGGAAGERAAQRERAEVSGALLQ